MQKNESPEEQVNRAEFISGTFRPLNEQIRMCVIVVILKKTHKINPLSHHFWNNFLAIESPKKNAGFKTMVIIKY